MNARIRPVSRMPASQRALAVMGPVIVAVICYRFPAKVPTLIAAALAFMLVVVASRRPARSFAFALVFLAVIPTGAALLNQWGVPVAILRPLGGLKEGLALGVLFAAIKNLRAHPRRPDLIDLLVAVYLIVILGYFLFPGSLPAAGAPHALQDRLLAVRTDAGFVLVMIGCRYAPMTDRDRRLILRAVLGAFLLVAFWGLYERLDPAGWLRFIVTTAHVPDYQRNVLHINAYDIQSTTDYIKQRPVRVASIVLSPFTLAEVTLIGIAISADAVIRGTKTVLAMAALGLFGVVMLVTQVRIELLASLAVIAVLLLVRHGRVHQAGRVRLVTALVIAVAIGLPFVHGSRLSGAEHSAGSNTGHKYEFSQGLAQIVHNPRGAGLGTAPDVGRRFDTANFGVRISDNSILQVGDELGVAEMVIFIALLLTLVYRLYRSATAWPDEPIPRVALAAFVGFIVAGMTHHVFLDYVTTWALFGFVGLALGMTDAMTTEHGASVRHAVGTLSAPVLVGAASRP